MDISEEVLGSLLDDDALVSESEERVLKGVVRWMKGEAGVIRGEGLLRKIRFLFMSSEFLVRKARLMIPESTSLSELGLEVTGWFDSAIDGGDGNREFFVQATKPA
jgi:hypothetical protein